MARSSAACETSFVDQDRVERVLCDVVDRTEATAVADMLRALSDPTRVVILHALASGEELCNCDLAAIAGISESAVSHQMRELRLLQLVGAEKRGRMVYYRLSDAHVRHILEDTVRHVREAR